MTMIGTRNRATIEDEIADLRRQQDRLPIHWADAREKLANRIDRLVDEWLAASA